MVEKIKCDHCGAEALAKYVVKKEFDGKVLNFCCRGCLQVYEMMHESGVAQPPSTAGQADPKKDAGRPAA